MRSNLLLVAAVTIAFLWACTSPGPASHAADPVAVVASSTADPPPPSPSSSASAVQALAFSGTLTDDRHVRRSPRSRVLLIAELQQLETLLRSMPRSSPDRPLLLRRIAEGYVELESAAETDRPGDPAPTMPRATLMRRASDNAVKHYSTLIADYPTYPRLDEALYYLAVEHERQNNPDLKRSALEQLVRRYPESKYAKAAVGR